MDSPERPLYEFKANMFKALSHPVRIRVLEMLTESAERQVSELLADLKIEPSHLSQHLSVLRQHGVVTSERRANAVFYRLTSSQVVVLLHAARTFLHERVPGSGGVNKPPTPTSCPPSDADPAARVTHGVA